MSTENTESTEDICCPALYEIITSTCFIITCSYVNYNIGIFTFDRTNAIYMHKWLIYMDGFVTFTIWD